MSVEMLVARRNHRRASAFRRKRISATCWKQTICRHNNVCRVSHDVAAYATEYDRPRSPRSRNCFELRRQMIGIAPIYVCRRRKSPWNAGFRGFCMRVFLNVGCKLLGPFVFQSARVPGVPYKACKSLKFCASSMRMRASFSESHEGPCVQNMKSLLPFLRAALSQAGTRSAVENC
jgi:hypothetical protein